MIQNFDDFCLGTYVLVDEVWPQIAPHCRRPGPAPVCSDPELVTMAVVGECRGWDKETVLLSNWHAHRDLFPHQPERSRFNRRRRLLLATLDLAQGRQCVLDSLPIPVIRFHLVPASNRTGWQAYEARLGRVPAKKQTIFDYKLYLLATLNGVTLDVVLAPANVAELQVGTDLLADHADLAVLGDKAFISARCGRGAGCQPDSPPDRGPAQWAPAAASGGAPHLQLGPADHRNRPQPAGGAIPPRAQPCPKHCRPARACTPNSPPRRCASASIAGWSSPPSCRSRH